MDNSFGKSVIKSVMTQLIVFAVVTTVTGGNAAAGASVASCCR